MGFLESGHFVVVSALQQAIRSGLVAGQDPRVGCCSWYRAQGTPHYPRRILLLRGGHRGSPGLAEDVEEPVVDVDVLIICENEDCRKKILSLV